LEKREGLGSADLALYSQPHARIHSTSMAESECGSDGASRHLLPKRLYWHKRLYRSDNFDPDDFRLWMIPLVGVVLFSFLPNKIDWRAPSTPTIKDVVWQSFAPVHLVLSFVLFASLQLLVLGPGSEQRAPRLVHVAHHLATTSQLMLFAARAVSAWSSDTPAPEEHVSYATPLTNALIGLLLALLERRSRLGAWGMLRARYVGQSAVGFFSIAALFHFSDGQQTGYPPGPTTLRGAMATWCFVGLVNLLFRPAGRRWLWHRIPSELKSPQLGGGTYRFGRCSVRTRFPHMSVCLNHVQCPTVI
jgi:hypothetical protein